MAQQGLEFEKSRVSMVRQDIRPYFICGMILELRSAKGVRVPQPTLLLLGVDRTPHLISFSLYILPLAKLDDGLSQFKLGNVLIAWRSQPD